MIRPLKFFAIVLVLATAPACAPAVRNTGIAAETGLTAADVERFQPDQLLDQRQRLQITDAQFAALQGVLRDRVDRRRTTYEAAEAGFQILTGEQRSAVRAVAPRHGHH